MLLRLRLSLREIRLLLSMSSLSPVFYNSRPEQLATTSQALTLRRCSMVVHTIRCAVNQEVTLLVVDHMSSVVVPCHVSRSLIVKNKHSGRSALIRLSSPITCLYVRVMSASSTSSWLNTSRSTLGVTTPCARPSPSVQSTCSTYEMPVVHLNPREVLVIAPATNVT